MWFKGFKVLNSGDPKDKKKYSVGHEGQGVKKGKNPGRSKVLTKESKAGRKMRENIQGVPKNGKNVMGSSFFQQGVQFVSGKAHCPCSTEQFFVTFSAERHRPKSLL